MGVTLHCLVRDSQKILSSNALSVFVFVTFCDTCAIVHSCNSSALCKEICLYL